MIASTYFLRREIDAVNRGLPTEDQISYFGISLTNVSRVKREYRRLYPTGKLDQKRQLFQYGFLAFLLAPMLLLGLGVHLL